jgi:hypothetical protein
MSVKKLKLLKSQHFWAGTIFAYMSSMTQEILRELPYKNVQQSNQIKELQKNQKKKFYQEEYRKDEYASLHREVWRELHPDYFLQWRLAHTDYFKLRYQNIKQKDPYYAREKSRRFRALHPDYYKEYRERNRKKLQRYWRKYKRKKRAQKCKFQ